MPVLRRWTDYSSSALKDADTVLFPSHIPLTCRRKPL